MKSFNISDYSIPVISVLAFIFSPILSFQEVASPGVIYILAIVFPTILYFFSHMNITHIRSNHVYAILFFIFSLISTLLSEYGSFGSHTLKFMVFVLYFIIITSFRYSPTDLGNIIKTSVFLSLVIAFLIILSSYMGYAHVDSTYYNSRYSIGITGLYKNPNYLASFMNTFLFILLYVLLFIKTNKLNKVINASIIFVIIIADYLTGTRASFMTVGVVLFVSFFRYAIKNRNFFVGIMPIIIVVLLAITMRTNLQSYMDLFLGNRSLVEDEGRVDSWQKAYSYIVTSPIFGNGTSSWNKIGGGNYYDYLHNIFLELFLNQGCIGFILFFLMLFAGFSKTKRNDRFFLLVFMFVSGFPLSFQNGLNEVNFWRFIILNVILIFYSSYNKYGIEESLKMVFLPNKKNYKKGE